MFTFRSRSVFIGAVAITAALAISGCGGSAPHRGDAGAGPDPAASQATTPGAPAAQPRAAGPTALPAGSSCAVEQGWGTGPKGGSLAMSAATLYQARAGRHACYDRVVFDVNGGGAVGFDVKYVAVVTQDGSGEPVPVAGRAALQVIVRAPIYGSDGHQPWRQAPHIGDHLVAPATISGWQSLVAVTYAGSYEGQTTIGVGVQNRRPFRVLVTSELGYRHVVVDIAH